jgi:hypothetical protein
MTRDHILGTTLRADNIIGPAIRKSEPPPDEWVKHSPGIERNVRTGALRTNIAPPPLDPYLHIIGTIPAPKPAPKANAEILPTFKLGDRVRVANFVGDKDCCVRNGDELVIRSVDQLWGPPGDQRPAFWFDGGFFLRAEHLELIPEPAAEIVKAEPYRFQIGDRVQTPDGPGEVIVEQVTTEKGNSFIAVRMDGAVDSSGRFGAARHDCNIYRTDIITLIPPQQQDGWIEWDGGECPLARGTRYEERCRDGSVNSSTVDDYDLQWGSEIWRHLKEDRLSDITAYRVLA